MQEMVEKEINRTGETMEKIFRAISTLALLGILTVLILILMRLPQGQVSVYVTNTELSEIESDVSRILRELR